MAFASGLDDRASTVRRGGTTRAGRVRGQLGVQVVENVVQLNGAHLVICQLEVVAIVLCFILVVFVVVIVFLVILVTGAGSGCLLVVQMDQIVEQVLFGVRGQIAVNENVLFVDDGRS